MKSLDTPATRKSEIVAATTAREDGMLDSVDGASDRLETVV